MRRTVEEKGVDIRKVTQAKVDYGNLADLINQSRRRQRAPKVSNVNLSQEQGKTVLTLQGENLAIAASLENFPVAAINDQTVEVMAASETELKLQVNAAQLTAWLHGLSYTQCTRLLSPNGELLNPGSATST